MAVPSESYIKLKGGASSDASTIYTSALIKIGDNLKISGTVSNNGVFTVKDIITTLNSASATGSTFTDATCDTDDDNANVSHVANAKIVSGLSVSGTGVQSGSYIAEITDSTHFRMNKNGDSDRTDTTLTFSDRDIYYLLEGRRIITETSTGSTDPAIEVIRSGVSGVTGDKLIALGDVDSAGNVDVWSNNATSSYNTKDNGWTAAAIKPTINGDDAKYIYHFVDEALRVCNINEENNSIIKWYGYIQRNQFGSTNGLVFSEWQEHPNILSTPKTTGDFSFAYITSDHTAGTATNYYTTTGSHPNISARGVAILKNDGTSNLRLNGDHNASTTSFTFENTSPANILDIATVGEVISIGSETDSSDSLGTYPKEFLFCTKTSGGSASTITYSRAYGGALGGSAPYDSFVDLDTPIIERGVGWNIGVDDGTAVGEWAANTYEFYQTFIYDGNQESLPVQMGDGESTIAAGTHESYGDKALRVSIYADLAYNGRITGGRIYIREQNSDEDLILFVDIDIVKGVRTSLDGKHNSWSLQSGKGFYVIADSTGNSKFPNLDTYNTINGFSPDEKFVSVGGANELYKASIVSGDRTFIANVKTFGESGELEKYGDRIMFSESGRFDTFLSSNFIDVSKGDYGEYTTLESYSDRLLAFKNNLVHIINIESPEPINWYLEDTVKYMGVSYPYSVTRTDSGIAWINEAGCFLYDGSKVTNLIDKRLGISQSSHSLATAWYTFARGSSNAKNAIIGYDPMSNSLVMFRSPSDDSTNSNISYIYDFDSKSWIYNLALFTDSSIYTNFITDWNKNLTIGLYDGASDVNFFKYLPIPTASSNQELVTRDIDFGQPGLIKKVYAVTMTYKSSAEQQTPLYYSIDGQQSWSAFATGSNVTPQGNTGGAGYLESASEWDIAKFKASSPVSCQSIQFRLNLPTSGTFEVNDITIEYRVIKSKAVS